MTVETYQTKRAKRFRRHLRARQKIKGSSKIPRLCVFRSNQHIYTQLIDDVEGHTLLAASDLNLQTETLTKTKVAGLVGLNLAKLAKKKQIDRVVFDRGGFKYHGQLKALAEGAREGGLKF